MKFITTGGLILLTWTAAILLWVGGFRIAWIAAERCLRLTPGEAYRVTHRGEEIDAAVYERYSEDRRFVFVATIIGSAIIAHAALTRRNRLKRKDEPSRSVETVLSYGE